MSSLTFSEKMDHLKLSDTLWIDFFHFIAALILICRPWDLEAFTVWALEQNSWKFDDYL